MAVRFRLVLILAVLVPVGFATKLYDGAGAAWMHAEQSDHQTLAHPACVRRSAQRPAKPFARLLLEQSVMSVLRLPMTCT